MSRIISLLMGISLIGFFLAFPAYGQAPATLQACVQDINHCLRELAELPGWLAQMQNHVLQREAWPGSRRVPAPPDIALPATGPDAELSASIERDIIQLEHMSRTLWQWVQQPAPQPELLAQRLRQAHVQLEDLGELKARLYFDLRQASRVQYPVAASMQYWSECLELARETLVLFRTGDQPALERAVFRLGRQLIAKPTEGGAQTMLRTLIRWHATMVHVCDQPESDLVWQQAQAYYQQSLLPQFFLGPNSLVEQYNQVAATQRPALLFAIGEVPWWQYDPPASMPVARVGFLLDLSGSMNRPEKWPLIRVSLPTMISQADHLTSTALMSFSGQDPYFWESQDGDTLGLMKALQNWQAIGDAGPEAGFEQAYAWALQTATPEQPVFLVLISDGGFDIPPSLRARVQMHADRVKLSVSYVGRHEQLVARRLQRLAALGKGMYDSWPLSGPKQDLISQLQQASLAQIR